MCLSSHVDIVACADVGGGAHQFRSKRRIVTRRIDGRSTQK